MVDAGSPHQLEGCAAQQHPSSPAAPGHLLDTQPSHVKTSPGTGTLSSHQLMQSALAALLPAQMAPRSGKGAAAGSACSMLSSGAVALAAPSSVQLPALAHLSDPLEFQLVAAAFVAGAAAGAAAGHLDGTLPLLDELGSGDISHSGTTADTAAVTAAPGPSDLSHESAETATTDSKQKVATGKRRAGAGGSCKSTFRGVFWDRKNHRWRAQVGHNNRKIFMGYFSEPTEAARAYDKKLVQLRGTMAKTNFPLQDYADDLQLHKELRARENGDELLLLPLEELQAHLQQHLQELLPKQPGLQKVYSDWSRNKAQAEAHAQALTQLPHATQSATHYTQQAAASMQLLQQGMPTPQMLLQLQQGLRSVNVSMSQEVSVEGSASRQGSVKPPITGLAQAQAQASPDAACADQQPPQGSSQLPGLLEQQWSTTLPLEQQQQQQLQRLQQQQQPSSHLGEVKVDPVLLASPHIMQKATGVTAQLHQQAHCEQQQRLQQHSRLSSPVAAHSSGHTAGGSPTSWGTTAAAGAAGSAGGSSSSAGKTGGSSSSSGGGVGGNRPQRDPPRSLQQHVLTRLHKQRCSSGSSMDALLAAAAVLEEEEEVALTLCEKLHQLVPSTPPAQQAPQQQQQQPRGSTAACGDAHGSAEAPAAKQGAGAGAGAGAGMDMKGPGAAVHVATADGGVAAAAAEAAAPSGSGLPGAVGVCDAAQRKGSRTVHGGGSSSSGTHNSVVTDTAAVVAAILGVATAQRLEHQQCAAQPLQQQQQQEATRVTPHQAQALLLHVAAAGLPAGISSGAAAEQVPASSKADKQPGLKHEQQQHDADKAQPSFNLPDAAAVSGPADPISIDMAPPLQREPAGVGGNQQARPQQQQQQQMSRLHEGRSHLGALQQQMLHPPTSEQQVVQTIQLAHRAGLDKASQQLLLLVIYHQVVDLNKQQQQQQQQQQQLQLPHPPKPPTQVQQQEPQRGTPQEQQADPDAQQQQQHSGQVQADKQLQEGVAMMDHDGQQHTAGSTAPSRCAAMHGLPDRSDRADVKALSRRYEDCSTQQQPPGRQTGQPPPQSSTAGRCPPCEAEEVWPSSNGRPGCVPGAVVAAAAEAALAEGGRAAGTGGLSCLTGSEAEAVVVRVGRTPAHSCSITAAPGLLALQAVMSGDVTLLP